MATVKGLGQLSAADVLIEGVPLGQLVPLKPVQRIGAAGQIVNVTAGVTDIILNRTVDGSSYITLQIVDPLRTVLRSEVFSDFGLIMEYDGLLFALAQFAKEGDQLSFQFEDALAYNLRRSWGAFNWASPTNLQGFAQYLLNGGPKMAGGPLNGVPIPGAKLVAQPGPVSFDTGSGATASSTVTTTVPIARGTTGLPNEDSWTCINRLGNSAGLRVYASENTLYLASDAWLIEQFAQASAIEEFTPLVMNIDGTYDIGMPFGQLSVTMICDEWPFSIGQGVPVKGMGKFNGTWLCYSLQRDNFNPQGSATLQAPMSPEQVRLGLPTLQYL